MKINGQRLLDTLKELRGLTDTPGEGVSRFSYGEQDIKVRRIMIDRALAFGCGVRTDEIGNIRISLGRTKPGRPVILCGSHIDTVRNGGWLDGIYGVCGGLEVLETLAEAIQAEEVHLSEDAPNFELLIFAEEEGSNFGSTMAGSKFLTGIYKDADLDVLTDDSGRTMREVTGEFRKRAGLDTRVDDSMEIPWDLTCAKAMIELHIEQGPVLERKELPIGIVDSIFGMRVIEVRITGIGNHAGATPMKERYDALSTAAECVLAAERIVRSDPDERTVVTVGKMEVAPNCSNVIPEMVKFSLEIRDKDEEKINGYMDKVIREIESIAQGRGVEAEIREHSSSSPLKLSEEITEVIRRTASERKIPHQVMDSGAVHDACMIAQAGVPTGMIFVPSIGGRSHVPEEDTAEKDLLTGAQLLLDVVADLCLINK